MNNLTLLLVCQAVTTLGLMVFVPIMPLYIATLEQMDAVGAAHWSSLCTGGARRWYVVFRSLRRQMLRSFWLQADAAGIADRVHRQHAADGIEPELCTASCWAVCCKA